ncbi:hypothetical protein PVAND_005555 [Polypedilum vanderplanki]|uniref:Transmembrane protein 181 n=1 Tax=Polypedilum vanderplanki TaxID=319348 RepID=A0A9J6C0I8_POLVA|nr:hypothetical protein PVAND_005555 [Polypedilum vanderplanki]
MSQDFPNIKLNLPHNRFKSSLTQISDFFSQFSPISPAINHDRPERSLPMRLYSLNKRSFSLVLMAFFVCFLLAVFIGIAGPEITSIKKIEASKLFDQNENVTAKITTGPFKIQSQALNSYARQLWLFAKYEIENIDETFDTTFLVSVKIKGLEDDKLKNIEKFQPQNRTRHLKCKGNNCEEFTLIHLGWLDYSHYQFIVNFYGLNHNRYSITKLTFYIKTFNLAFTSLEISFRLIFLFFTFIVTMWYYTLLRKHPSSNWTIEQKFTYILLPLLIFYDNPLFPLMFLVNSWFVGMLDALFQSTFLCALLLFWISIYHALRQSDRKFLTFYLPKLIIITPIWICAFVLAVWEKLDEYRDPFWIHFYDGNYSSYITIFYTSIIVYMICLIYMMLSAYSDLRSMHYFDMRLKFLSLLMLFVIIITSISTLSRFGFGTILLDNFVGQLATSYKSSAHFMCFYGMINFYVITITYVYSPISTINEPVRKDNPAFSMINDSDEDVVYASEEESRRPLNVTDYNSD